MTGLVIAPASGLGIPGPIPFVYDVKNYGARGDGATDDTANINRAIAAASASAAGGTVYFPGGTYICSGTLSLPAANDNLSQSGPSVNLKGEGPLVSVLKWNADLGAGNFGVVCTGRGTGSVESKGYIEDLGFLGAAGANPALTMGTAPVNMNGLGLAARRSLCRVFASGFNQAICVTGDHGRIEECHTFGNAEGLAFDIAQAALFGDWLITKSIFEQNAIGCITAGPNVVIQQCHFDQCIAAGAPFGLYKKTGGTTNALLLDCLFSNMQIENFGNCAIADDQASTGRLANINFTRFLGLEIGNAFNATYKWAAKAADAVISINQALGSELHVIEAGNWVPGSVCLINCQNTWQGRIKGDIDTLISNVVSAAKPFSTNASGALGLGSACVLEKPGVYEAFMMLDNAGIAANNIVVVSGGFGGVANAAGAAAEIPRGVCLHTAGNGAYCIIAQRGTVSVKVDVTVTAAAQWVRTSATAGTGTKATGKNDATTPGIGYSVATPSGGLVSVVLQGLA